MSDVGSGGGAKVLVPLSPLLRAIGERGRYRLLQLLADGQPKMVTELAQATGRPVSSVSSQLLLMKKAGVVVKGQAGMYRIPAHFLPQPGMPLADFGYFTLRLDVQEPD